MKKRKMWKKNWKKLDMKIRIDELIPSRLFSAAVFEVATDRQGKVNYYNNS